MASRRHLPRSLTARTAGAQRVLRPAALRPVHCRLRLRRANPPGVRADPRGRFLVSALRWADIDDAANGGDGIPGIDFGSASTILVEIGPDLGAFRQARHLGAWAGVAPGNNTSAGKRRSGRARQGNQTLRATLAECAHGAVRTKRSQFFDYHRALAGRIGYKRAILATAHKLLRVTHAVLRKDRPYTDPGIDYQQMVVERNAPRWLRMLRQYGFLEEARATARS